MKKLIILAGIALMLTLTACSKHVAKNAQLATKQDSLNYAYGAAIGEQIKMYNLASDSLFKEHPEKVTDAIVEALLEAYEQGDDFNNYYNIGLTLGRSIRELRKEGVMNGDVEYNEKALKAGLVNELLGKNEIFEANEADSYLNRKLREINERKHSAVIQQLPPDEPDDTDYEAEQLEELQIAE